MSMTTFQKFFPVSDPKTQRLQSPRVHTGQQTKAEAHSDTLKPQKKRTGKRAAERSSFPPKPPTQEPGHKVQIKTTKPPSIPPAGDSPMCPPNGVPLHPPRRGPNAAGRHELKAQVLLPGPGRSGSVKSLHTDLLLGDVVQQLDLHRTARVTVVNLRTHQRFFLQALRFALEAPLL